MNRKDIVLVACMINMGLLVILFVGGIKKDPQMDMAIANYQASQEPIKYQQSLEQVDVIDQVDQVLNQYIAEKEEVKEEVVEEVKVEKKPLPVLERAMVKVVQGDYLEKIAKNNQTTVEALMQLNKMKNTKLKIGQVIYLPSQSESTINSEPDKKLYTVKDGESPWTIAIKHNMKVEDLLRLNHLDEKKAKRLKPGDELRIQ